MWLSLDTLHVLFLGAPDTLYPLNHLFSSLIEMPNSLLPPLRRIVTIHGAQGLAVVESDLLLKQEVGLTRFPA